jgi:phosphinothricin acetyltransferase
MMNIRDAVETDLSAILAITNHAILVTTAMWSVTPVDLEGRTEWWRQLVSRNFPVLVAEINGEVIGFGSYGSFRPFEGYAHTVEHRVYVAPSVHRRGAGAVLLRALIDRAIAAGIHVMIGAIDAENEASLALHRRFGFVETGRMPEVGRKFDRWLDLVLMQKILGR